MRRIVRTGWALALALAAAAPAAGQGRAPIEDPEGVIVQELVVTAPERGPAWWRIEDADTTVWILGIPDGQVPPGAAWDRAGLEKRLKGASALMLGETFRAGLRDIPALLRLRRQLRSKTPVEEQMGPSTRARFVAAREAIGKPASRYADWQPILAGQILLADIRGKGWASVEDQVRAEARRSRTPIRRAGTYKAMPFLNTAVAGLTPQSQGQCLGWALDDIEAGTAPAKRAAQGWARGDVAAALTAPRNFDRCLLVLAGGPQLWRSAVGDQAQAIAGLLATPGHAVAVVPLRRLLAKDGVIETLEARGVEVRGPRE